MGWAVFQDGTQVSKSYPLKEQALIDAVERKMVWNMSPDFDKEGGIIWLTGCEIKPTESPSNDQD